MARIRVQEKVLTTRAGLVLASKGRAEQCCFRQATCGLERSGHSATWILWSMTSWDNEIALIPYESGTTAPFICKAVLNSFNRRVTPTDRPSGSGYSFGNPSESTKFMRVWGAREWAMKRGVPQKLVAKYASRLLFFHLSQEMGIIYVRRGRKGTDVR